MAPGLAHVESVNHLMAIASDSLVSPKLQLLKVEYKDGKVSVLWRTPLPSLAGGSVQSLMRRKFKFPHEPFKGWPKGRYWEVELVGNERVVADSVFVRTQASTPFGQLKLSYQLALLLFIYGPLSPSVAARGLDVSEQQVKGAAAALARKQLIVKGLEPYTPTDATHEAFRFWLQDEMGDRLPRWVQSLLRHPELAKARVAELKRRAR